MADSAMRIDTPMPRAARLFGDYEPVAVERGSS
jgi:hypothetical protein